MAIKIIILSLFLLPTQSWGQSSGDIMGQIDQKYGLENQKLLKAIEADDDIDPEKYSSGLKDIYWTIYESLGNEILELKKMDKKVTDMNETFQKYKEPLEALEFKESNADKLSDKVTAHIRLLNDKVYHSMFFGFFDFMSWQREASIKSPTNKDTLSITTNGYCAGGGWGRRNAFRHFFMDGCFMFGYGNVGAEVDNVTYKQSNVPTYGFKASVGGSLIVSSLGAEVGLKLPLLFSVQNLDKPNQSRFPGYKIDEGSNFLPMVSIFSLWPVGRYFIQTEYARILRDDLSLWSIGAGYRF